ncbi:HET-domain-containing protein [Trametes cingulata]|nr:HET-domain-containing protein [Trametes cingulata]
MRLIDTHTGLFHWVSEPGDARYAILSHVWNRDGELSFEELLTIQAAARHFSEPHQYIFETVSPKVRELCAFAREQGIPYVWNDTCCIDKSSSAELSEAINSMYKWYQLAELCVAYLEDVDDPVLTLAQEGLPSMEWSQAFHLKGNRSGRIAGLPVADPLVHVQFCNSRWFTRGFTLQELIAPKFLTFVSRTWHAFGTKQSFADVIEDVTGIPPAILTHQDSVDSLSVAQRFSWASDRNTTREEDKAYSLMGIFGVNMPTTYGEGGYAFIRLQEEILKRLPDDTMFVWGNSLSADSNRLLPFPSAEDSAARLQTVTRSFHHPSDAMLFAPSPSVFHRRSWDSDEPTADQMRVASHEWLSQLLSKPNLPFPEYTMTCYGVRARLPLLTRQLLPTEIYGLSGPLSRASMAMAILGCTDGRGRVMALLLEPPAAGSRAYRVGSDVQVRSDTVHGPSRIASLPCDWVRSESYRVTVKEIYIVHTDGPWRDVDPPPIYPLLGVAKDHNFEELFDIALIPWCESVLRCEGYAFHRDVIPTTVHPDPRGAATAFPTHIFHFTSARIHVHITAGPCSCESGHGLVRVTVSYRWRNLGTLGSSYVVPRELLPPPRRRGAHSTAQRASHNTLVHVTTWNPEQHSSSTALRRDFSLEMFDRAFYTLRLTVRPGPPAAILLSVEMIDVRDRKQKVPDVGAEGAVYEIPESPDIRDLEGEAKTESLKLGVLQPLDRV